MRQDHFTPIKPYYPHEVGWITPPRAVARAVNDFVRLAPSTVGIVQRALHAPGFAYTIEDRARNFHLIEEAVECLAECGVSEIVQMGTNFVHSAGHTPETIGDYAARIEADYGVGFHMEGLCFLDAMKALGATRVALYGGYNLRPWMDGYLRFIRGTGLQVTVSMNLADLGFFPTDDAMHAQGYIFDGAILPESIERILEIAPDTDAILVMSMPCWTDENGAVENMMDHVNALEARFGLPIVDGEMALFWSVFRSLGVVPDALQGRLMQQLRALATT